MRPRSCPRPAAWRGDSLGVESGADGGQGRALDVLREDPAHDRRGLRFDLVSIAGDRRHHIAVALGQLYREFVPVERVASGFEFARLGPRPQAAHCPLDDLFALNFGGEPFQG